MGPYEATLVLDPLVFFDGEHDADLLLDWLTAPDGWGLFVGWRATSIILAGGTQWQEKSLLGVSAGLPPLLSGWLRGRVGLELGILWVKHGGDLPTDWLQINRGIGDLIQFGIFVRIDMSHAF